MSNCSARFTAIAWHKAALISSDCAQAGKQVPKQLQRDATTVAAYVDNLIKLGDQDAAEDALLHALRQEWSATLVRQYGYVHSVNATRQLARAESWLIAHPEDAQLLLCLGRLSAREKLWGKARDYFESCYRLERSAEICAELGRLLTGSWRTPGGRRLLPRGIIAA